MNGRRLPPAAILAIALVACVTGLSGCGGGPAAESDGVPDDLARLRDRFDQEYLLHRDREALALGEQLLARGPGAGLAGLDGVLARMITAAIRLPDLDRARDLALQFPERFPDSPEREPAMTAAARALRQADRPRGALAVLAALAASEADPAAREQAVRLARPAVRDLDDAGLRRATAELAATPLAPSLREQMAARELTPAGADTLAATGRIGVLAPVTGRYARFGNAFQAGVRQALTTGPRRDGAPWEMVLEDSEGDPVGAALATRRLCGEHAVQVVIGSLLSASTAVAALVADRHGVPVVSPTATNERLGELGGHVLQTNLTGPVEAEILGRLCTEVLLKRRYAVIRPDAPEAAALARHFLAAVTARGGEVVDEQLFDASATDFREPVLALREARPEVVFAPVAADQMVLLGPQLDFYRVGALVVGPSAWTSERLLDRAGSVMERAICTADEVIFPAEWMVDFVAQWPADQYDDETTRVARGAYLATRMVLSTLAAEPGRTGPRLAAALRDDLLGRDAAASGPGSYAATVHLVRDGALTPFPAGWYAEALHRQAVLDSLVAADTLSVTDSLAVADSLGLARVMRVVAGDPAAIGAAMATPPADTSGTGRPAGQGTAESPGDQ